jgi:pimeloyl-ACP methyl ester carboxylesterase
MSTDRSGVTRREALTGAIALAASHLPCPVEAEPIAARRSDAKSGGPAREARAAAAAWLTLPPTPTLPDAARSGLAAVNGVKIFYAQFGSGPPVLLLHGGMGNSNYWGHQVRKLAESFSVTVMDTRGHGRSPLMSSVFTFEAFARDVSALLDFLEIPSAAIVGWSDGGITGLQLAITDPKRVSRLFAFGANATTGGLIAGGARSSTFASYAARCRVEYAALSPTPNKWPQLVGGLRVMWRTEPNFSNRQLSGIAVPTTISAGEHDEIIKPEQTRYMAHEIPGAQLVIQRNVSHFAMLQDPAQFNAALAAFLSANP